MLTLNEIEKAVDGLAADQKRELHRYLEASLQGTGVRPLTGLPHSVLDIPVIQLGSVLLPVSADDDLLDEMLEERS